MSFDGYDEDELEELADLWDVSVDEVEDLLEAIGPEDLTEGWSREEVTDYIDSLAEEFDIDAGDLWDLYFGYEPGASAA